MKNFLDLKKDFPIFDTHPDLIYLDSAATSQKPQIVIDAVSDFYKKNNSNIHRGIYTLSQRATDLFEQVREKTALFINANSIQEIIFTSSTTESINLVATGYARKFLKKGDIVLLSEMEHHSNIVPWIRLKEEIGVELEFIPVTSEGILDYESLKIDYERVKFISLTHVSNVLGTINPIKRIVSYFKKKGVDAKVLIDAAQSIPHMKVDVADLDCDFLVFSSHKMLGPSGVGVLWAKEELLEEMDPLLVGSHMIKKVSKTGYSLAELPDKFEAGTRNIEGVIGLGAAIDYLQNIGLDKINKYEQSLTEYALDKFKSLEKVQLFGPTSLKNRTGVFSFAIGDIHPHDIAEILNRDKIAVRSGHHCAQVLMECLGVTATTRASLYFYNTEKDIDKLIAGIKKVKEIFKI